MSEPAAQGLLSELRRRRVFRALVGYGIAAFAVLQVIEPVMHGLHWPDAVLSYVVVALALGFPIVVVLAWIFDVKAGRLERTEQLASPGGPRGLEGARLALLVGVGLLAAAPGLAWYFFLRPDGRIAASRDSERSSAAERKSIAILPFVNMSSDKENEYFSDGMTEEVINALANVEGLRVASRTSAFAFKGKNVDVREVGEKLNVSSVLEGSIRKEGTRLRITAQLINAGDGYHLWSTTYERELNSIFAVEEELARSIVNALRPRLVQAHPAPLVKPTTTDLAAHDLYSKGRYFWSKRTAEGLAKARAYFEQAIEQDPNYALAYVALADSTALSLEYGSAPAAEVLPKAKQTALKALEIDGTLAEAHEVLGLISLYNYEWSDSERELRRAIELKPENGSAHHRYAITLADIGRVEESRSELERARQLEPTSLIINTMLAWPDYVSRDYPRAVEQAKKALELDATFPVARMSLASAYLGQKRYAEAVAELEKLKATFATLPSPYAGGVGYAYAMSGQRSEALRTLEELQQRSKRERIDASGPALIYIGLGDKDQAFAWLDRAYAERDPLLTGAKNDPVFDSLRSDPRFTRLLKRMHLE